MASTEDAATYTGSSLSQFENKPDTITQLPEVTSTLAVFLRLLVPKRLAMWLHCFKYSGKHNISRAFQNGGS
jgi:hypothetical protein